ncbi:MAG TPA: hypothetical protein VK669_11905 [Candidatus Limnocylindrales bacterium]|nr:hypothetical protein [Candidatus Limnocylindrales bacterium]
MLYLDANSCIAILPHGDSTSVRTVEAQELLDGARELYQKDGDPDHPLSAPLLVRDISGRTATLAISREMYAGNLQYGSLWRDVYRMHHRDKPACVRLRLTWKTGSSIQNCCIPSM